MTCRNRKCWLGGPLLAAVCLAAATSQAAPVAWTGSTLIGDGTADIVTSGVLVEARNVGGAHAAAITAGGVPFQAASDPVSLPLNFGGFNPDNITGDADFDSLLNSGAYAVGLAGNSYALTLTGLSLGIEYLLQLFVTDSRPGSSGRSVTVSDGLGSSLASVYGDGYVFNGLFTADSVTQNVFLSGFAPDLANTGSTNVPLLNAWQLRSGVGDQQEPPTGVPEPATVAVLAIGLAGMGWRRRRSPGLAAAA